MHRQVEELLGATDEVREVSTEMLGGLRRLMQYDHERLARTDPDEVAREVATVFAQFERLVTSTRASTPASLRLNRYDLGREDFQAFKAALLDHPQRFVDEVARSVPQIAELLTELERQSALLERAATGTRLLGLERACARRSLGCAWRWKPTGYGSPSTTGSGARRRARRRSTCAGC